ncbi:MAG: hypothetical protein ACX939_07735 [Hyphococcus sp.]
MVLIFLAACAGAFAVLLAASEWIVRVKAMPQDTLTRHAALFNATRAPYIALGDSHVARGFDAAAPVVNLAYPSENIEKMAWKAQQYLARKPDIRGVLIQADPHLLAPYRIDADTEGYESAFADASPVLLSLSTRYRPQLIALWQSYLKNGGRLRSKIETTPQGALLSPGDLSTWSEIRKAQFTAYRLDLHMPDDAAASSSHAILYQRMVEQFLDAGASVCLVAFPTAPVFRTAFERLSRPEKTRWDGVVAFYQSLAAHPRVRFLDHRAMYDDASLFRDPDHLNHRGAVRYGPVLQSECFNELGRPDIIAAKALPN